MPMQRCFLTFAIAFILAGPASGQSAVSGIDHWYGEEYQKCDGSTVDIVECVGKLHEQWDRRLNAAYRAMMAEGGERASLLRDAQRKWIAFRDADCDWYGAGEGTIARIEAVTCAYALTRDRALELEMTSQQ